MFMFAGSTKEKLVTSGVIMACCLFAVLAIRLAYIGKYAFIFALLFALLPMAIMKGMKLGYVIARFFFAGGAVLIVAFAFNPFAYEDVELVHGSYVHFVLEMMSVALAAVALSYCLNEHARLRKTK